MVQVYLLKIEDFVHHTHTAVQESRSGCGRLEIPGVGGIIRHGTEYTTPTVEPSAGK